MPGSVNAGEIEYGNAQWQQDKQKTNKSDRHIFQCIHVQNILGGVPSLENAVGHPSAFHRYKSKKQQNTGYGQETTIYFNGF